MAALAHAISFFGLQSRPSSPLSSYEQDLCKDQDIEKHAAQPKRRSSYYTYSRRTRPSLFAIIILWLILALYIVSLRRSFTKYGIGWHALESSHHDSIDWSKFAYVQYATNENYLCNSVMLFETLHRLESKPDRLLLYPSHFQISESHQEPESVESRLLRKARDEFNVKLQPIEIQYGSNSDPTWAESYTKLLAFNQTQYARVLSLDSDSTLLQPLDSLFAQSPAAPVAMPRAYWLDDASTHRTLASHIILIQPSQFEYNRVMNATAAAGNDEYDMEIMNKLYGDSAMVLPHRGYALLTGEFRAQRGHAAYLGSEEEEWDAEKVVEEAKFVHFSDWPRPKPWLAAREEVVEEIMPKCEGKQEQVGEGKGSCRERDLWLGLYEDFAMRRKDVCG